MSATVLPEAAPQPTYEAEGALGLPPLWVPPPEVDPVSRRDLADVVTSLSRFLGMRTAGWVMLGGGVLLLVAAWLLRWQELRVAGILAILLVLVAALFTIGRPKFDVAIVVPDTYVQVDDDASGSLHVRNVGVRRTLPSRVDLPIGARTASLAVPSLAVEAQHDDRFTIPTDRRAVVAIGPAQSVQGDPFSLMGRDTLWTDVIEVFVHPKTVRLPGRQTGFIHDLEGHPTAKVTSADMSFHALREYVAGDDRRHIHWRSSARTGDLMVRQYEETRQSRMAVALDQADQSYGSDDEFEDAVSVAASFVMQAVREENPLALVTNVEVHPGQTATSIMNELSRVQRLENTHVTDVARLVRDRESDASIVVLITGSKVRPDRLRHAATLLNLDCRVIAIRVSDSAVLSVETVANVTLVNLPVLADLPKAMRRAML
ncbi:MAG TPA: DUF58 domain-containing protein [Propionibacteriaceae bacterium]|nr:DUF58 domain-containing protein [Propionibacteriaceae bacterium]